MAFNRILHLDEDITTFLVLVLLSALALFFFLTSAAEARNKRRRHDNEIPYFRSSVSVKNVKINEKVKFACDVANLGK